MIQDSVCGSACTETFDTSTSTTYVSSTTASQISYGGGNWAKGYKVHDTVALSTTGSYEATSFNFLLATSQHAMGDMPGLMGFSRTIYTEYNMFYDELYQQSQVSSNVFAIYMAESTYQSTLEIGSYDMTNLASSTEYATLPLLGTSLFYVVAVEAWQVGSSYTGPFKKNGYTMGYSSPAILDTGTTLMMVPQEFYQTLMDLILEGTPAINYKRSGMYIDYCSNSAYYKSLYLLMGTTWMEVPPSAYLREVGTVNGNSVCMIGIQQMNAHYWLLGDIFLKNFYTVWDNTNQQMFIGPHITSSSTWLTTSTMSAPPAVYTQMTTVMHTIEKIGHFIAEVGFVAFIAGSVYWVVKVILGNPAKALFPEEAFIDFILSL